MCSPAQIVADVVKRFRSAASKNSCNLARNFSVRSFPRLLRVKTLARVYRLPERISKQHGLSKSWSVCGYIRRFLQMGQSVYTVSLNGWCRLQRLRTTAKFLRAAKDPT